jgi:hypothetical protein
MPPVVKTIAGQSGKKTGKIGQRKGYGTYIAV